MVCYSTVPTLLRWQAWLQVAGFYVKVDGHTDTLGAPELPLLLSRNANSTPHDTPRQDYFD